MEGSPYIKGPPRFIDGKEQRKTMGLFREFDGNFFFSLFRFELYFKVYTFLIATKSPRH
jgi:hypothetical protein